MMEYITEELLAGIATGELPYDWTTRDLDQDLNLNWARVLSDLDLAPEDGEFLRECFEEDWFIHNPNREPGEVNWWRSLSAACKAPTRFLGIVPLGARDYGRGDQDDDATHTVFFESTIGTVRVAVHALPDQSPNSYRWLPQIFFSRSSVLDGTLSQSLSMCQWTHGLDDSATAKKFASQGAFDPEGQTTSFLWGTAAGPDFPQRSSMAIGTCDLLELMGRAIAMTSLAHGTLTLNAQRASINVAMKSLYSAWHEHLQEMISWAATH